MGKVAFKPVSEHLLYQWTMRLLAGETGQSANMIATEIIEDFCMRASLNQPQSHTTLNWLANALDQIMKDGKPDAQRAFSLMPRREGGAGRHAEAIDIALWLRLTMQRGYPESDSKKRAAEVFHKDPKHIGRQGLKAAKWAEGMNPNLDWDEYFKLKRRPLPRPARSAKVRGTRTR